MTTRTEIVKIEKETNDALSRAKAIVVKNQTHYDLCINLVKRIKEQKKMVDEAYDKDIKNAHTAWKGLIETKKRYYEPLEEAEKIIKSKLIEYTDEQRRIENELRMKAEEEARKAEEKRKAELEAQAKKWEEKGNIEKAEERRSMAEEVIIKPTEPEVKFEKSSNSIDRQIWKAKIKDLDKIPRNLLIKTPKQHEALMSLLNEIARTTKGAVEIDGVEFYSETSMAIKI